MLLKDLLKPEESALYKNQKFDGLARKAQIETGLFAKRFQEIVDGGTVPIGSKRGRVADDYFTDNGISIYFPYSQNFNRPDLITIVSAQAETDIGTGREPYTCGGPRTNPDICYDDVTVDDNYAVGNPTHVVGVGAEPAPNNQTTGTQPIKRVFLRWIRCTKQYDRLISFTGNGGGSEIRVIRGSGYLKVTDQQVTNTEDLISVDVSRRDIRNSNWEPVLC